MFLLGQAVRELAGRAWKCLTGAKDDDRIAPTVMLVVMFVDRQPPAGMPAPSPEPSPPPDPPTPRRGRRSRPPREDQPLLFEID